MALATSQGFWPNGERWRSVRARLVANPKFQNWAARSPLTRFIARRRAKSLFDLCAGFVYSQTLYACVRLDLFAYLAERPRSSGEVGRAKNLSADSARRLLRAAASLKLLRALADDRFALDDLGAAMLGNPSIAAFVSHHAALYDDLRDPVALLRGETETKLSKFWPYAADRPGMPPSESSPEAVAPYSALMATSQEFIAEDVLGSLSLRPFDCLLDVGGGEGVFAAAAARRAPGLNVMLFDLPAVAERARARVNQMGLAGRIAVFGGSFLSDPLPEGADLVSLVRVLHDHDDESALAILAAVRRAMRPRGTLLVAEPMAETSGAESIGDAYFGFYLLAMGRGRARSAQSLENLLRQSGFARFERLRTPRPLLTSALLARVV